MEINIGLIVERRGGRIDEGKTIGKFANIKARGESLVGSKRRVKRDSSECLRRDNSTLGGGEG